MNNKIIKIKQKKRKKETWVPMEASRGTPL
jgi:hypothetical protein